MAVGFDPAIGRATTPRALFTTRIIAVGMAGLQYDVAPDGQFIFNALPSEAAALTLLTGWPGHLRQ